MAMTDKLTELGRSIGELGSDAVLARERPSVEQRLAALQAARAKQQRARGVSLRGPVAVGLAIGAAAASVMYWTRRDPLTFTVGEPAAAGEESAWIVAPPAGPTPLHFSDGTEVRLDGGARVRVLGVTANGARVAIERGSVRADVVHRAGAAWSVVGGPFEIRVTGTSFDAGWDPEREELRVTMHDGRVIVRAACLDHERALVAGDAATLSCAKPSARAPVEAPAEQAAEAAPTAAPAARSAAPVVAAPSGAPIDAAPGASASASATSWRELARRGDYKGALAAADAEGFDALTERLGASDLLELGTTARLAGNGARATEAYSAVRRRFAGGEPAATAAFHLGQMAFDGAHAYGEARRWFSAYLAERPGGALAVPALGRSMEAAERTGDHAAAREMARTYLARYPTGAHAALANSLLAP